MFCPIWRRSDVKSASHCLVALVISSVGMSQCVSGVNYRDGQQSTIIRLDRLTTIYVGMLLVHRIGNNKY